MDENIVGDGKFKPINRDGLNDAGNARKFAEKCSGFLRFDHTRGEWIIWNGKVWEIDSTKRVMEYAKETIRELFDSASTITEDTLKREVRQFYKLSMNRSKLDAMIKLAESEIAVAAKGVDFDNDEYLLNMNNGIYDLRNNKLSVHNSVKMLTRIIPIDYDETAEASHWRSFIERIFRNRSEVAQYLQKAVGAALGGRAERQELYFCYGLGANGKSTFFETIKKVFGPYIQTAPIDMLIKKKNNGASSDIARLKGARIVIASETDAKDYWDEEKIKVLTGGETLTARYLYKEHFEFNPTHSLFVLGNHLPGIRGADEGIWRRMKIIPFAERIKTEEQIPLPDLIRKFIVEEAGILNWFLEGYKKYKLEGLIEPVNVATAIVNYRSESDQVGRFISSNYELNNTGKILSMEVYDDYVSWCSSSSEYPYGKKRFYASLKERDIEMVIGTGNKQYCHGILKKVANTAEQ